MPIVQVQMLEGISEAQAETLIKELTETVCRVWPFLLLPQAATEFARTG